MTAFVVCSGRHMFTIWADVDEELVIKAVVVEEVDQRGAHVVSDLGGVNGPSTAG